MSPLMSPSKRHRCGTRPVSPSPSPSKRRRRSDSPTGRLGSGTNSKWNPNTLHDSDIGFHPSLDEIAFHPSPIDFLCDHRLSWIAKRVDASQNNDQHALSNGRKEELVSENPIWSLTKALFAPSMRDCRSDDSLHSSKLEQGRAHFTKFKQWLEHTAENEIRPLIHMEMEEMLSWKRKVLHLHEQHKRGDIGDTEHKRKVAEYHVKCDDHMWKLFIHSLHISDWAAMTRAASALKLHNLMSLLTTTRSYGHPRREARDMNRRRRISAESTEADASSDAKVSDDDDNISLASHSLASSFISRNRSPRLQKEPYPNANGVNGTGESSWWQNRDELVSAAGLPSFSNSKHSLKRALTSDIEKQKDFWQKNGTWQAIDKRVKHVYALLTDEFTTRDLKEYSLPTNLSIFRTFRARHKSGGRGFNSILELFEAFIKFAYKSKATPSYARKFDDVEKNLVPSPVAFELMCLFCALAKLEASGASDDEDERNRNTASAFDWFMGVFTAGNFLERDRQSGKSRIGELEMHWCMAQVLARIPALRDILLKEQDWCMTFVFRVAHLELDYRSALWDADFSDVVPAKCLPTESLHIFESTNLPTDFSRTKRAMFVLCHTNRWLYKDFEHMYKSEESEGAVLRGILADILENLNGGPRQRLWSELEPLLEHWGIHREVLCEVQADWFATIAEDYLSAACLYKRVNFIGTQRRALEFVARKVVPEMLTANNVYSWQYRNQREELAHLDPLTAHHVEQLFQLHAEQKRDLDRFHSPLDDRQRRFITTRLDGETRRCFDVTFDGQGGKLVDTVGDVWYTITRRPGDISMLRSLLTFSYDAKHELADAWNDSVRLFLDLLQHGTTPELLKSFHNSWFLASKVRVPVRSGRNALRPGELCTRSTPLVEDPYNANMWEHAPVMRKFLEVLGQRTKLNDDRFQHDDKRNDMQDAKFVSLQHARRFPAADNSLYPPHVKLYE